MKLTKGLTAVLVLVLVAALALGACGADEESADQGSVGGSAAPADLEDLTGRTAVRIDVPDNSFTPRDVEVDAGTEVTWSNIGRNEHNVVPDEDGAFEGVDTADFQPGTSYSTTFDEPGTYGYHCTIHGAPGAAGQAGTIVVAS